jgi:hypothetical protein
MVEVFKTDVSQEGAAKRLIGKLQQLFPGSRVNFDLEDCDKVLRVEGHNICCEKTIALLKGEGYNCLTLL